jgi:hypothetical protein
LTVSNYGAGSYEATGESQSLERKSFSHLKAIMAAVVRRTKGKPEEEGYPEEEDCGNRRMAVQDKWMQ